jgi:hypothetical protein
MSENEMSSPDVAKKTPERAKTAKAKKAAKRPAEERAADTLQREADEAFAEASAKGLPADRVAEKIRRRAAELGVDPAEVLGDEDDEDDEG